MDWQVCSDNCGVLRKSLRVSSLFSTILAVRDQFLDDSGK